MTDAATSATVTRTRYWLAELRSLLVFLLAIYAFFSVIAQQYYIPSESMMPSLQVGDRLLVSKYPYGWSYASASYHLLPPAGGRLFGRMPARGDIVVLSPPDAAHRGEDLIKRVIGLPGDTIQVSDGRLWLNGKPVLTQDMGYRAIPIDGHFRCDPNDPDPGRAFPAFNDARTVAADGKSYCRVRIMRETLPNGRAYDTIDFGHSELDDFPPYAVPEGHVFLMGDNRDNSADSRAPVVLRGLGGAVPVESISGRAEFVSFSLNGNATWNPLTWLSAFRANRAGATLRPPLEPAARSR